MEKRWTRWYRPAPHLSLHAAKNWTYECFNIWRNVVGAGACPALKIRRPANGIQKIPFHFPLFIWLAFHLTSRAGSCMRRLKPLVCPVWCIYKRVDQSGGGQLVTVRGFSPFFKGPAYCYGVRCVPAHLAAAHVMIRPIKISENWLLCLFIILI